MVMQVIIINDVFKTITKTLILDSKSCNYVGIDFMRSFFKISV